ncbi:hypothetical protein BN977_02935 [Mycolicibacterium cosmeticum]|uniref:Uncharacterized protein n=1 Tax=Mycolicibacterium cosmeticum TaxID=258533 RepID=W9AZW0_MYCCO|nr:hypothetical protein BN977_02935 [Mycolicibacterium cosmeticum]
MTHMHPQSVPAAGRRIPPQAQLQLVTGHRFTGTFRQRAENLKLCAGEWQRLAAEEHPTPGQIDKEIADFTAMRLVAAAAATSFAVDMAPPQRQPNSPVQRLDVVHRDGLGGKGQRGDVAVAESNHADLSFLTDAVKHGRTQALSAEAHDHDIGITLAQCCECSTGRVGHLHGEIAGE